MSGRHRVEFIVIIRTVGRCRKERLKARLSQRARYGFEITGSQLRTGHGRILLLIIFSIALLCVAEHDGLLADGRVGSKVCRMMRKDGGDEEGGKVSREVLTGSVWRR